MILWIQYCVNYSANGSAETTFTIASSQTGAAASKSTPKATTSPQTGNNSQPLLWIILVGISGAVLLGATVFNNRKKKVK